MVRRKKELRLELRLYSDTDADLIAWVEELDSLPHGYKAQAIKETLRQGRGEGSPVNPSAPAALDIRALVDRLLPELRPMVEAAVLSALARSGGVIVPAAPAPATQEDTLLSEMVAGMMLDEEEDA